jgi:hypothetical protein
MPGRGLRPTIRPWGVVSLFSIALPWACGDGPTEPILDEPGYVLTVEIPGVTDATFRGEGIAEPRALRV